MTEKSLTEMGNAVAIAIYATHETADGALRQLQDSGLDMQVVSVIGKGYHTEENPVGYYTVGPQMKVWGGKGTTWSALWGGVWGLLYSAGFFLVPGVGPILVAGPLVGLVAGAVGAVEEEGLSALGSALLGAGVPRNALHQYEGAIKADHILVIVHGEKEELQRMRAIMDQNRALSSAMYIGTEMPD